MKTVRHLILAALILLMLASAADAKWWIFGKSEDEVGTKYLYLDNVSFDEITGKATLYKEALVNGMVTIKGKATSGKSKIVAVEVTIDGKATWKEAQLNPDTGDFIYTFTPELDKLYSVYVKMIDTAGKTNKIETTFREFVVTNQRIVDIAGEALNRLISAYQNKSRTQFLAYVSDDFIGGSSTLDRAISKDFSAFDNIKITYTINNISAAGGKVFLAITYNRSVYSLKGNRTLTDNGWTEFVFEVKEQKPMLFSMKNPLMFGLSDASNVATGNASNTANTPILVVDQRGNASTQNYSTAIQTIQNESSSVEVKYDFMPTDPPQCAGIEIVGGGEVIKETCYPSSSTTDIYCDSAGYVASYQNTGVIDLGLKSIETVTQVPTTGYSNPHLNTAGHSYALKLARNNKYAVVEIVSISGDTIHRVCRVKYKYQPDGTPNF